MVISVEAGAVAEAIAPSSSEKSRGSPKSSMVPVTAAAAASASSTVTTTTRTPLAFSLLHLKNLPTPKAIKASAASVRNDMASTVCASISFRQCGPIKIPARMYPVTLGKRKRLAMRDRQNAASSVIARSINTCAV